MSDRKRSASEPDTADKRAKTAGTAEETPKEVERVDDSAFRTHTCLYTVKDLVKIQYSVVRLLENLDSVLPRVSERYAVGSIFMTIARHASLYQQAPEHLKSVQTADRIRQLFVIEMGRVDAVRRLPSIAELDLTWSEWFASIALHQTIDADGVLLKTIVSLCKRLVQTEYNTGIPYPQVAELCKAYTGTREFSLAVSDCARFVEQFEEEVN